jgi:hypothetical protein
MSVMLIHILGGLALGCATAGAINLYMLFSRPYRKAGNRLAISQVFVAITGLTGLISLQKLEKSFSVALHSSAYYSIIYAYVFGLLCGFFFILRAEFRWRRSSGLVTSAKNNRAVIPGAYRRLLIALGILALSFGFSVAYWLNRPKSIGIIFGSSSLLFLFMAVIFLGRAMGAAEMREMRIVIFVLAAALFCMLAALAWKFRKTDPPLSSVWLVTLVMPCLVALSALFFMRPQRPNS